MSDILAIQKRLVDETKFWVDLANEQLNRNFEYPTVQFDLRGTTAGQAWSGLNKIRYNIELAMDNLEDFSGQTVGHEVAHIIADRYFAMRCNHGRNWKWIMKNVFGLEPTRCHDYDVSAHRARKSYRYKYQCNCSESCVAGPKHHNAIKSGRKISCRRCKIVLSSSRFIGKIEV